MRGTSQATRLLLLAALAALMLLLVPAAQAATFTTSNYGSPSITNDSNGTLIGVPNPPAGLYYKSTLDPARDYRVTVTGQAVDGNFSFRLRRDTGPFAYRPAPNATESFVISNTTKLELLFYSSRAGSYRVRSISVSDCTGTCKTDADLRSKILAETPGLQSALSAGDRWNAAKLILRWASPKIDWSGNPDVLNTAGYDPGQLYFEFFQPNVNGVFCGGAADFYRKVLALFAIPAFEFDFGDTADGLTHATVVMSFVNSDGTTDYRIVDPTFNMDFTVTPSGKPASVPVMWEMWRAGMTNRIAVNTESLAERRIFQGPTAQRCADVGWPNGGCGFDAYLAATAAAMTRNGYQTGLAGFLQLQSTTTLFSPDTLGVPADFQSKHDTFKQAVASGDSSTHVAPLPLPPSNDSPPVIQGQPVQVGRTLTTTDGGWSSSPAIDSMRYQWQRCDAAGENCSDISGATGSSYTPVDADAGGRLAVLVYAHNENGWSDSARTVTSDPTATVQPPENITPPRMSGTAADGSILQLDDGGYWQGTQPFDWSYKWLRCDSAGANCQVIPNATSYRYQLTSSDIGSRVKGRVVASNPAGTGNADSSPSNVVVASKPVSDSPPTLSGTARDSEQLVLSKGDWSGTAPIDFAYQWVRCDSNGANCADIASATDSWRNLNTNDVGSRLKVRVVATNSAGSTTAETALTAVVAAAAPQATQAPRTSGTAADGSSIQLDDVGRWSGTQPFTYAYQWVRCDADGTNCADIAGSTSYRRVLTSADVGKRVRARVTATNSAGSGANLSDLSAVVAAILPKNDSAPTISGTPTDGEAMTLSKGNWSGTTPQTYAYQWVACDTNGSGCQDISGATTSYRKNTAAEVGKRLKVRVTATNAAGSAVAETALTNVVAAAPPANTSLPLVDGNAKQGQFLTLTTAGDWTGTRPFTWTYAWVRCNSDGTGCQDIPGATAYRYKLVGADGGKRIKARVTATNSAASTSAFSALSAIVN
jgi:hypothetical protein